MFIFCLNLNRIRKKHKITAGLVVLMALLLIFINFRAPGDELLGDVYFLGRNMRGCTAQQVEEMLIARFAEWQQNPVEAAYNAERQLIVPELWGYRVNIEETLQTILTAPPGSSVAPVFETVEPEVVAADFPAAFMEKGNPLKNEVALMINVAWGTEYLHPMLDVLDANDAQGTFFVVGRWAQEHGPLLREIASRGHELANHGHTDAVVYTKLSPEEMAEGLEKVNMLVKEYTGSTPKYYTPHKGEYNQLLLEVVSRVGMRTVLWSVDTVDWQKPGVEKMKEKILKKISAGGIILMHPTADTVLFLQETIPLLQEKGFAVVTISELLSPERPPALFFAASDGR